MINKKNLNLIIAIIAIILIFSGAIYLISKVKVKKTDSISFNNCGEIDQYSKENWYSNFIKNIPDSAKVGEACISNDGTLLIVITEGSYCTAGSLFKYDITKDLLSKAEFNDHERGCVAWPTGFGKKDGEIIHLQGFGGDAGCSSIMYYEYNYIKNIIELKKECNKCEGDLDESCKNY